MEGGTGRDSVYGYSVAVVALLASRVGYVQIDVRAVGVPSDDHDEIARLHLIPVGH